MTHDVYPILIAIGMVLLAIVLFCVVVSWLPFFYNYRFSSQGIDILTLGGTIRVLQVRKDAIKSAYIKSVKDALFSRDFWKLSFALSLGNRFKSRVLVVETTGLIRRWCFTPKNPEEALARLMAQDVPGK